MIEELQALRVKPDEVLIIKIPDGDWEDEQVDQLNDTLVKVGLGERSIIVLGDVEFIVRERKPHE